MSACDFDTKSQEESMCKFPELEKKMDSMGWLKLIKKIMLTPEDIHTSHNNAMVHINMIDLHQDRFTVYRISEINT